MPDLARVTALASFDGRLLNSARRPDTSRRLTGVPAASDLAIPAVERSRRIVGTVRINHMQIEEDVLAAVTLEP